MYENIPNGTLGNVLFSILLPEGEQIIQKSKIATSLSWYQFILIRCLIENTGFIEF